MHVPSFSRRYFYIFLPDQLAFPVRLPLESKPHVCFPYNWNVDQESTLTLNLFEGHLKNNSSKRKKKILDDDSLLPFQCVLS